MMLREPATPPAMTEKLRNVKDLVDSLRVRLDEQTTFLMNS